MSFKQQCLTKHGRQGLHSSAPPRDMHGGQSSASDTTCSNMHSLAFLHSALRGKETPLCVRLNLSLAR
eukprot:scaffold2910_cov390-Prasinococcus_capsulatus_cf.AAC.21